MPLLSNKLERRVYILFWFDLTGGYYYVLYIIMYVFSKRGYDYYMLLDVCFNCLLLKLYRKTRFFFKRRLFRLIYNVIYVKTPYTMIIYAVKILETHSKLG